MLYRAGGQEGSRGSKTDLPEKALWLYFSLPPPPSLLLSVRVPDSSFSLCILVFSLSFLLQAQCDLAPHSPLQQPDHALTPTEADLHSFSATSVMDLVSLPDSVLYDGEKGAGLTV